MDEKQKLIKDQVIELLQKGLKIEAIKFVFSATGSPLVDAKRLVDKLEEELKK